MTKAELVSVVAKKLGIEKVATQSVIEAALEAIKASVSEGEPVYLRGFGAFSAKQRAKKTARNITKGTTIVIPAHKIPAFKPSKSFTIKK